MKGLSESVCEREREWERERERDGGRGDLRKRGRDGRGALFRTPPALICA